MKNIFQLPSIFYIFSFALRLPYEYANDDNNSSLSTSHENLNNPKYLMPISETMVNLWYNTCQNLFSNGHQGYFWPGIQ